MSIIPEYAIAATRNALQQLKTAGEAKRAYEVWAHRVGASIPFELLSLRESAAWKEVAEFLTDEPECRCGAPLLCPDCDKHEIAEEQKTEPPAAAQDPEIPRRPIALEKKVLHAGE